VFVNSHSTNQKGSIAELKIAAAAAELGVPVLAPMTEHGRYDLAFEVGGRFLRVQCKWAARKGGVVIVNLASYRYTSRGHIVTKYGVDEIDAVAAYCGDLDECYLLPAELVAGMRAIQLRLEAPKNGQMAALHWTTDYSLSGAVAQLGRARRWQPRGRGFESHQLHSSTQPGKHVVGAHDFRNRFGWYMERSAAGEEFLVTRRGKPYVRLLSARDQLALESSTQNGGPGP
jgi:prevent-host-death family protein